MNAPYHHGDLRTALLAAAEDELSEKGAERFSLRAVAKRAGVSHAAPAHHFGDVNGLLTALAAVGYQRFLDTKLAKQEGAETAGERLLASGLGYIAFAQENPALFRLMFGPNLPDKSDEEFQKRSEAAFQQLIERVSETTGADAWTDPTARTDVVAVWAIVHGLADLMIAGRPKFLTEATAEEQEAMLREIISRALPRR